MGKILLFILVVYVIYYAGNIIYDLFFDKELAVANQDEGQLVSMKKDDDPPPEIKRYDIDAVENVEAPNSYDLDEDNLYDDNESPTNYDADTIRRNYEEEAELDKYSAADQQDQKLLEQENQEKKHIVSQLFPTIKTQTAHILSSTKEVLTNAWDDDKFDDFLNLANQHVVLTSNIDGHKVFKSTL